MEDIEDEDVEEIIITSSSFNWSEKDDFILGCWSVCTTLGGSTISEFTSATCFVVLLVCFGSSNAWKDRAELARVFILPVFMLLIDASVCFLDIISLREFEEEGAGILVIIEASWQDDKEFADCFIK